MSFENLNIDPDFIRELETSELSEATDSQLLLLKRTSSKRELKRDFIAHIRKTGTIDEVTTDLDSYVNKYESQFQDALAYIVLKNYFNDLIRQNDIFIEKRDYYRKQYNDIKKFWDGYEVTGDNYTRVSRIFG